MDFLVLDEIVTLLMLSFIQVLTNLNWPVQTLAFCKSIDQRSSGGRLIRHDQTNALEVDNDGLKKPDSILLA